MTSKPIKISDNCWKHIDEYSNVVYKKTSSPESDLHRENGPAIEWANGDKDWYINGKRHREDGPAIELADGDKFWYVNGKRHRINDPAIEYGNGHKEWYFNDKCHRTNGPAVELANGVKYWYYYDKRIYVKSQEEFELYLKNLIFI